MTGASNNASLAAAMPGLFVAFDFQQINSAVYFAAATLLIFTAAVLAGRRVNQQLPLKWLVGIAGLAFVTLSLIWLLLSALNRKEATPPSPPPDYPAGTGSP
jgi:hypothetical protein